MVDKVQVRVGQVWTDTDPRVVKSGYQRRLRVIEVSETHAVVDTGARKTKIRLDRFRPTSTGYRLVAES